MVYSHLYYDGDPCIHVSNLGELKSVPTDFCRICGANSDLFGRRWFIIGGNVLLFIGFIVGGTAKNNTSVIVACAFIGFVSRTGLKDGTKLTLSQGAGNAQLAAFALPELLPNKWRHSAIVLAGKTPALGWLNETDSTRYWRLLLRHRWSRRWPFRH